MHLQCDEFPPAEGDFLDLPAGGSFTIEIASNRAKTSLSYNGKYASDWPDGSTYPADYVSPLFRSTSFRRSLQP